FGGNFTLERPVAEDWQAAVGLDVSRVSIRDGAGDLAPRDRYGNPLSFSATGIDDLVTVQANVANDQRDNPRNPTTGSHLSLSSEQSLPVGSGSILNNRLEANYAQFVPTRLFGQENPEVLAVNVQAGTTIGDLPPHQAFNLGGSHSIRGYNFSEIGGGRSYALASAEYRVPILTTPLTGVVFADFGTDLGSSAPVQGENGEEVRQGSGFGYGAGLRLDSPLGVIRADLGFSDRGNTRLHFGLGHRF
ncbi:MAG: BamA/TamA family outer membrane protein, partial [Spirulinaceae cyanobacterium RM2_2_10]|nr:BamA/TamA family outer membrane protein [Spirulinaceae cyanobacterium RM2_2_10]